MTIQEAFNNFVAEKRANSFFSKKPVNHPTRKPFKNYHRQGYSRRSRDYTSFQNNIDSLAVQIQGISDSEFKRKALESLKVIETCKEQAAFK